MSKFQKILLTIPVVIYSVTAVLFIKTSYHDLAEFIFLVVLMFFAVVGILILRLIIYFVSSQRISLNISLIISLWIPLVILSPIILWTYLQSEGKDLYAYHKTTDSGWTIVYDGQEKAIDENAKLFAETRLRKSSFTTEDYKFHFQVLKRIYDDSAKYLVCYFYEDLKTYNKPKMMSIEMTSDLSGQVTYICSYAVQNSHILTQIYNQRVDKLNAMNNHDIGSNPGTRKLNDKDILFTQTILEEDKFKISTEDITKELK